MKTIILLTVILLLLCGCSDTIINQYDAPQPDIILMFDSQTALDFPTVDINLKDGAVYLFTFTGTVTTQRLDTTYDYNDSFYYWDYEGDTPKYSEHILLNDISPARQFRYHNTNEYDLVVEGDGLMTIKILYRFEYVRQNYKWIEGYFKIAIKQITEN